jgi:branched-chain amino acid transport system permease protein
MLIFSAIVNGILYGGVLAILAYGLNLVFGVVEIVHFFYGQCLMVGLYVIYVCAVWLHIPLILSCLIGVAAVMILNVLAHTSVIQRLLGAPLLNQFLALASVMIILENAALVTFGAGYKGIPVNLPVLHIGELYIRASNLIAFLGSLITLGLLHLFLNKTYWGLAIHAVAQDREAARLMGINPGIIYIITLATGGILAGIAASFFVPIYSVHPHFGGSFTLAAFVVVVLGGMGNLLGGFISAFIIGVVTMLVATLTISEAGEIAALCIFLVVIMIRPQGVLGRKVGI